MPELQRILDVAATTPDITIDMQGVRHVYREAVGFLASCRDKGIKLKNCPAYVRELFGIGRDDEQ